MVCMRSSIASTLASYWILAAAVPIFAEELLYAGDLVALVVAETP